ncbi:MAG: threonine dehydratase [Vicinamibacteraceae bacterium]
MNLQPPTLMDVVRARARLGGLLPRTPLLAHPLLAAELGCDVRVKHENHLPTGAFKIRGGLNLVSHHVGTGPATPIVTASTGNHGQSIALACQRHGVPCTVFVPVGNNPDKNAAMRAFGAELVEHGRDFDEAREELERRLAVGGVRYVHSANEPLLIAGVGTYALEIFEELPDVDVVFVAVGGGSGASGLVTVRDALGSRARIIGVQAAGADAFARSWRTGTRVTTARADTFAEGIATRVTFDLPFGILAKRLDDVVTLTEQELADGVRLALHTTHNLAEGAGAASLAAAWQQRDALRGKRIVCVMSGCNLSLSTFETIVGRRGALQIQVNDTRSSSVSVSMPSGK